MHKKLIELFSYCLATSLLGGSDDDKHVDLVLQSLDDGSQHQLTRCDG